MTLTCGPFCVDYEDGFLRQLRHGGDEVLRMIYFALRDENWINVPLQIGNQIVTPKANSFEISYRAINTMDGVAVLEWSVNITGSAIGEITFDLQGVALADIWKNRAGFCILHPIKHTAGKPVAITHSDGTVSQETFPSLIAPENPFKDVSSMEWDFLSNRYRLIMDGDIFETEDQRNWCDASFKTFCTPLSKPFPVRLEKGTVIHQRVIFKTLTQPVTVAHAIASEITVGARRFVLPQIGLRLSTASAFPAGAAIALRALAADHLRIESDFTTVQWERALENNVNVCAALGIPVECVFILGGEVPSDFIEIVRLVRNNSRLASVTILEKSGMTTGAHLMQAVAIARSQLAGVPVGAGTMYNFTEINRFRMSGRDLDFVMYSLNPQEHATDSRTVIENLECIGETVRSTAAIYNLPVRIAPITLKRRFNPYTANTDQRVIPPVKQIDERLYSPFAAAWLMGCLKQCAESGVASVTFFETIGPLGVITNDGKRLPVYDALKALAPLRNTEIVSSECSTPLVTDALVFEDGHAVYWNYTEAKQSVRDVMGNTLILEPYQVKWQHHAELNLPK